MSDNNLRKLDDDFTEIVGSGLHYYEKSNGLDLQLCTFKEITDIKGGWVNRYRNDQIFNAKVKTIVAHLMTRIQNGNDK